ncbi:MAG: Hydroxyacylglutathione hydrolase [Pseudomonadota bacterium]|jgi:hydroxyacylglutathione hydrolase
MATLEIHQFICRKDNYGVLIRDPSSGAVAAIDAPNGDEVQAALDSKGWKLTHIFTTHHHRDHTDGHLQLKAASGCQIIGPKDEEDLTPGIDKTVVDGDVFDFGAFKVHVLDTRGHTIGHVTYWIPDAKIAFAGDTLFAMGCGNVRDGNYEGMWNSLQKIRNLPPETRVYCGHEYTQKNAEFALTIEPQNAELKRRYEDVKALRAEDRPTLPTTVALELATNPFLRPQSPEIRHTLGMEKAADWQVFGEVRIRKNNY